MAKLKDVRQLKEINLKTIPEGKIWIYDGFLAKDLEFILKEEEESKKPLLILGLLIKDWNLEDDDGKKLPISEENIGKLNILDINQIISELNFTADFTEKKTEK
jgi:hypothetical protein